MISGKFNVAESELQAISGKLDALSPLKVLERGYSISYKLPEMNVIRESQELKSGDRILIKFHRGRATCAVEDTED